MAEQLTLTTPETTLTANTWRVTEIALSVTAPSIKVTLTSDTGASFVWRYVPNDTVTEADVRMALSVINQGRFATVQSKTLDRWVLERIIALGVKAGTVTGDPE